MMVPSKTGEIRTPIRPGFIIHHFSDHKGQRVPCSINKPAGAH